MAKINFWYGRLGNNILQIGNALTIAYLNRSTFSCPGHEFFSAFSISFGYSPASSGLYFDVDLSAFGDPEYFKQTRSDLLQEFFLPKLNLPKLNPTLENLLENGAIATHARGGDTFDSCPHPAYVPHPLDYYLNLAKTYEKIILVYEDKRNPVVETLSKNQQFHLVSSHCIADFSIFTKATEIALGGFGTFVPAACMLNKNISKIIYTNVSNLNEFLPIKTKYTKIFIDLEGYIEENGWTCSSIQKQLILNYKIVDQ